MSVINPEAPSAILFFEDVLPKTGWGIYYKFMLGMACASHFAQATAFTAVSFANSMWICENYTDNSISMDIHTYFVLGRALGGFILSSLCDMYGRKKFLTYSLVLIFLSTFIAAFGCNYYVLMLAVFFIGSGVDCNITVFKVHLAEILPQKRRGCLVALCDLCWTFGYILIFMFATFMKTSTVVDHRAIDMRLSAWRMMFAISGAINLILACASALLEESPRYFLNIQKKYLALLILKQYYAINNSSYAEKLDVKENDLSHLVLDYNVPFQLETNTYVDVCKKIFKIHRQSIKLLFKRPFVGSFLIILAIKTALLMFGTLDINILLAKHLTSRTITDGMEVVYLDMSKNETTCSETETSKELYGHFSIIAVGIFAGQILTLMFVDGIGRKIFLALSLAFGSGSFILSYFIKDYISIYTISLVLMMTYSSAFTTASIVNIESFPTAFRCTSVGITNILGLIIQIIVIRLFFMIYEWHSIIMGLLYIGSAVAACFIQELKKLPMFE